MWILLVVSVKPAAALVPAWNELEAALPSLRTQPLPVIDAVHHVASPPSIPPGEVVLYRERNGWCPYSERAWLALERVGVSYTTVLIDNIGGRPSWFDGTTPRIRWPDGSEQSESMTIVRGIDSRLGDGSLYAPNDVDELVAAFSNIFPRATRPSSRAAFLFKQSGALVFRSELETTLTDTDVLLAARGGPFFCGAELSAADIAWAPFLERYAAQLPLLYAGLDPLASYPRIAAWFDAFEARCPPYFARVRGDDRSWAKVLEAATYGNAGSPPATTSLNIAPPRRNPDRDLVLWRAYGWDRDGIGRTPSREAATRIVRNRHAIAADAVRLGAAPNAVTADEGLRRCVAYLIDEDGRGSPRAPDPTAAALATYLSSRVCVPRDMGAPPAAAVHALAAELQTSLL